MVLGLIFDRAQLRITNLSWIYTSMQKISSLHLFIIKIQPIFESRDHTGET